MNALLTRLSLIGSWSAANFFSVCQCEALDPARAMSQYVRRSWDLNSGFPGGPISAITQSSDGYLWIGTEKGLVRFDGMTFSSLRDTSKNALSLERVLGLTADRDGGLWIRLPDPTIVRYRDDSFSPQRPNPNHDSLVSAMTPGLNASIIFASRLDGLFAFRRGRFETLLSRTSLPWRSLVSIATAPAGDVWLGTRDAGLFHLHANLTGPVTNVALNRPVTCLLARANEEVYIGTDRGLLRWDGARLSTIGLPAALTQIPILALAEDHDANIWIGTGKGLLRLNSQGVSSFGEASVQKKITALFEDREGEIWAGGLDRIERIQESPLVTYEPQNPSGWDRGGPIYLDPGGRVWSAPASGGIYVVEDKKLKEVVLPGIERDEVYSIAGDGESLWLGTKTRGLIHVAETGKPHTSRIYTQADGLPGNSIYTVHLSRDGSVWAGTLTAGVSHFQNGVFTNYSTSQGLASNTILSITEGADGTMWFGTAAGLSRFAKEHWRTYGLPDGLPSENIPSLFEDDSGILWLGTLHGIVFVRAGKVFTPARLPPPLSGRIFGMTQDAFGSLWIATPELLLRVDRAKLLSGSLSSGDFREFGASEGLKNPVGIRRERSIATSRTGRIWLSRNEGVGELDPSRLQRAAVHSIVHIERVIVDGEPQNLHAPLALPWNVKRIVFEYAGLNLSAPDQVRFKFKLDDYDQDWSAPVYTRSADYTNLGPGSYRLHVIASNADRIWGGSGTEFPFHIDPAVWQTWWFRSASVLLIILTAGIFYILRLRQITESANIRFETRLAERTRIARELHDTLLQSFHGLMLRFQAAQNLLPEKPAEAQKSLAIAIERAAKAITEGRDAVQELRSSTPGTHDFVATLTALGHQLAGAADSGAPVFRVLLEGTPRLLRPGLQEDLYRIVREAVANAIRHAKAASVELEIRYDARMLRLRVRDDGIGMEATAFSAGGRHGHWGITGMQERAKAVRAQLEIWSESNRGTEIQLTIPSSIVYVTVKRSFWSRFRK